MCVEKYKNSKKGQLSLEFLIVFTIFLALLVVSLSAIAKIKQVQDREIEKKFAELAASDIANTIDEVCILGEGNSRVVGTNLNEFELFSTEEKEIQIEYQGSSISRDTMCDFEIEKSVFHGQVAVSNSNGKISIK